MNPSATSQSNPANNPASLFEGVFERTSEFEKQEEVNDTVSHSPEHLQAIAQGWAEFYSLKSEVTERPISKVEIEKTTIETQFSRPLRIFEQEESKFDAKPIFLIEEQKGSGSFFEEAGLKLDFPGLIKETTKSLSGVFSIFKEIFIDTVTLVAGKKEKKAGKIETDPEKAKAAAEKKAENQRKQNNIRAFYEGLKSSAALIISPEAARMETQEKANINLTAKIGNESYKGIKDSFGRLTTYAASMFERAQLDQEKQAKKIEKEQKVASVNNGPDLNMDKVAEGGFLSATGGQGAG